MRNPSMRKLTAVLIVLSATTAFAGGIQVTPSEVTLTVGDHVVLHAFDAPGGLSSGYPYYAAFYSDNPAVAGISGVASGTGYGKPDSTPHNGDVFVTAVAPGIAHARYKDATAEVATIIVRAQPVLSVHPDSITVPANKPAMLWAGVTDAPSYVTFAWYRGHTGDESKPLQLSSDPALRFTPQYGTTAVWVRAVSGTWTASAEAKVTVTSPRRRAVR